ncbi:5-oxoprolinase subunit B family protein [Gordonia sp. NPDC003429]
MRELPAGADAVLLDFADDPDPSHAARRAVAALRDAVDTGALAGIEAVVPAAETVLVQGADDAGVDLLGIHRVLRATDAADEPDRPGEMTIPVRYTGDDLADVASALGLGVDNVISAHRDTVWEVQFMGFAPGFGYLVPLDDPDNPLLRVPRRETARTRVPTGAVAIAAGYSAVYPRESPGGWNLLGHTSIRLWNPDASPPALLAPGSLVRFVDADAGTADTGAADAGTANAGAEPGASEGGR